MDLENNNNITKPEIEIVVKNMIEKIRILCLQKKFVIRPCCSKNC